MRFPHLYHTVDEIYRGMSNVARMRQRRGAYRVLVGKTEGKRPLGRPKYRQENNIENDLKERRWESVDWIDLAQYMYVVGYCECDNI